MARELTITIRADGTQAKQTLSGVEQGIEKVEQKAGGVDKAFEKTFSVNLPKVLGVAAAAIAAVDFGQMIDKTVDAASRIADAAQKMGIGAEAIQKLKFAAEQSGSSLDAVGVAIRNMSNVLVDGSDGTIKLLGELGLNLDNLRAMKPEDAFLAIAEAIREIPNPMKQSADAVDLFGRSGSELLPAIKNGFKEVGEQAPVMAASVIEAGDRTGDKIAELELKIGNMRANALLPLLDWFTTHLPGGVQAGVVAIGQFTPSLESIGIAILAAGGPKAALAGLTAFITTTLPGAITAFVTGAGAAAVTFFTVTLPTAFTAIIAFLGPQGLIALAVVALGLIWYKWGDDIKAIVSKVYTVIKEYLVDKFNAIVGAVKEKVDAITGFFGSMYDKVVGNSYVPDMVDLIGEHFGRLDSNMVRPTYSATMSVEQAFHSMASRITSSILPKFGSEMTGFMGGLMSSLNDLMTGGMNSLINVGLSLAIEGVKKIGSAIKGLFQSEESSHVNGPRDQFFAQFGGYDGLANDLTQTLISQGVGDAGNTASNLIRTLYDADTANKFKSAQQSIIDVFSASGRAVQGFVNGTQGRYQDFGAGSLAVLHGKERVMTEAEGRAEAGLNRQLVKETQDTNRRLDALLREFRTMPLMMKTAAQQGRG